MVTRAGGQLSGRALAEHYGDSERKAMENYNLFLFVSFLFFLSLSVSLSLSLSLFFFKAVFLWISVVVLELTLLTRPASNLEIPLALPPKHCY